MRRFELVRSVDTSGVSGTGTVVEGVEFGSGQVALTWLGEYTSVAVYPDMATVVAVHGHGGNTTVRWLDPPAGADLATIARDRIASALTTACPDHPHCDRYLPAVLGPVKQILEDPNGFALQRYIRGEHADAGTG